MAGTTKRFRTRGRLDAVLDRDVVHDHVVDRALDVAVADAEPGRGVALRIEVDDEHPESELGEGGAEVHGRRGLADAALLVGDREDPGQRRSARRRRSALGRSATGGRRPGRAPRIGLGSARRRLGRRRRPPSARDRPVPAAVGLRCVGVRRPASLGRSVASASASDPQLDARRLGSRVSDVGSGDGVVDPSMRNQRRRPRRSASSAAILPPDP